MKISSTYVANYLLGNKILQWFQKFDRYKQVFCVQYFAIVVHTWALNAFDKK